MKKASIIAFLTIVLLSLACYYRYEYRLVKADTVETELPLSAKNNIELISLLDKRFIAVLGVIDSKSKIILFHTRRPVLITPEGIIQATLIDGEPFKMSIKNVKFLYLKREMPTTIEELNNAHVTEKSP